MTIAECFTRLNWRRWTRDAIDCYNRHCVCAGCPLEDIIEQPCRMKYAVISLVRTCGKPTKNSLIEDKIDEKYKTIERLLDEGLNCKEIAQKLGRTAQTVQHWAKTNGLDSGKNRGNWRKKNVKRD